MKKLLFVSLVVLSLLSIAATANENALQIAGFIILAAPFLLALIGKYFPLDGKKMVALMYGLSVVVALAAGYLSGLFTGLDTMPGLIVFGTAEWGLVQLVYQLFNQSGKFSKYVN